MTVLKAGVSYLWLLEDLFNGVDWSVRNVTAFKLVQPRFSRFLHNSEQSKSDFEITMMTTITMTMMRSTKMTMTWSMATTTKITMDDSGLL